MLSEIYTKYFREKREHMPYTCIVKQGNLLDEKATFIVNASNTALQLGSGVSAAFKKTCGIELQDEMLHKLLSLERKLQKGDVIATSSGRASHFNYALHAAVMDYNQGTRYPEKQPSLDDIRIILENIEPYLQWYHTQHPHEKITLALPLLGCGVGGLDKQAVLHLYKTHFQRQVPFEFYTTIYTYNHKDYQLAQKICFG